MAQKVVLHISDRDKWQVALRLAEALVAGESAEEFQLVIVADIFAGAVCLACSPTLRDQLEALVAAGHQVRICGTSLRALNLKTELLPEFVTVVPNSLAEIISCRDKGYQYLKI
jgi:intracellular sulfur oxidation DsrE/DsrF family protein